MAEPTNDASVEAQWDAFTGTEGESPAEPEVEQIADDTDTLETADPDLSDDAPDADDDTDEVEDLRAELAQLRQQQAETLAYLQQQAQQPAPQNDAAILQRIEDAFSFAMLGTNLAVQQSRLTPEDAREIGADMRKFITQQELQRARQPKQPSQAAAQGEDPRYTTMVQATQQELNQIVVKSGLKASDPEYAFIPKNLSHANPYDALREMYKAVETAKRAKEARLGLGNARRNPVDIPMGGGTGAVAQDAETLTNQLNAEFNKPNPDTDKIARLNAALSNAIMR